MRKIRSKEREENNRSYIAVDKKRFTSSRKDQIAQLNNTTYGTALLESFRSKQKMDRDSVRNVDVETFSDPNSQTSHTNILNVVSPNQTRMGFHITDLLNQSRIASKQNRVETSKENAENSLNERFSSSEQKFVSTAPYTNVLNKEDKYMIKNFKIINMSDHNASKRQDK